jgi:ankyrin repeat protein
MLHPVEKELIEAVWNDDVMAVLELFQRHGSALNPNIYDEHGDTPLVLSSEKTISGILLLCGADPDVKDGYGNTALHIAIISGDLEMVKLLISHSADVNIKSSQGRTALQHAKFYDQKDIVNFLQDHIRQDIQKKHFNDVSKKNITAEKNEALRIKKHQRNIEYLKKTVPPYKALRRRPNPK